MFDRQQNEEREEEEEEKCFVKGIPYSTQQQIIGLDRQIWRLSNYIAKRSYVNPISVCSWLSLPTTPIRRQQ